MPKYRVLVTNPGVTAGVGPALVTAANPTAARTKFAETENTTVDALATNGLTWWSVDQVND